MNQKSLITIWKAIPLLCAFSFSLLIFVCCFFVKETISALPFLADYIDAGKSIFLPFIPRINLFFFLPEEAQILPFTVGHLLDFIILANLSMVINPIALPFCKKVSHEYQNNLFYDLYIGNTRSRQRPTCALLDVNRVILLDRRDVFGQSNEVGLTHASTRTGMEHGRTRDDMSTHEHPFGRPARLRAIVSKSMCRQFRGLRLAGASFLYRFQRLPGRDLVTARFHFARAVFASLFVSKSTFLRGIYNGPDKGLHVRFERNC
jgi:hypothetical protein